MSDDDKANNGQSTHPAEDNSILNTQTLHEYCQTMTMNESVAPVLSKQEDLPTCPLMNKEKASHPESESDSDDMPLSHLLRMFAANEKVFKLFSNHSFLIPKYNTRHLKTK